MKSEQLETITDNEAIRMVQQGDTAKLGILYERHHENLFKYFYRLTSHREVSEDMVHNTFMKVLKYNKSFTGSGQFAYWLFSIARNIWVDHLRKKDVMKNNKDLDAVYHLHSDDEIRIDDEAARQKVLINQALNTLTPEKKEAIVLSKFHGMKYQEIAEMAACTENAIKSRIKRGLYEMRLFIQKYETLS